MDRPAHRIEDRALSRHLAKLPGFMAVAELGSFSRAARKLHVSQPALSQSVQTLEEALGLHLFVRTPKGAILSDAGRRLHRHCKRILTECDGFDRWRNEGSEAPQRFTIGTKEPLAIHLWPRYVRFFSNQGLHLAIDLVTNDSNAALLRLLRKKEVDAVMLSNPSVQD